MECILVREAPWSSGLVTWCLIQNAHLGKIPSFCKILDLKIQKQKLLDCWTKLYVFHKRNSQKLSQKRKWALWMRHQLFVLKYVVWFLALRIFSFFVFWWHWPFCIKVLSSSPGFSYLQRTHGLAFVIP
jgi:hypothetical protein